MSSFFHRATTRLVRGFRGLAVFGAFCGAAAFAADDNQVIYPGSSGKSQTATAPATGGLNTVTLVLGVALAGAGGWMVWRNRRGVPVGRDTHALTIQETRSLGNRQYIVVASYEQKKFLLGVCQGSIQLLSALPDAPKEESER
jgi:flagellar protein FliO/FliZ